MPSYTYRCHSCQHVESVFQSMQAIISPPCSVCGGLTEKIIAQAPVVLKQSEPVAATNPPTKDAPAHECGSACVFHQHQQGNPSAKSADLNRNKS
ncbi:MAG: Zinc ribbon domain [Vampirovibrio sp.]|jgi:putative FmdB family regulatory protein|nr:Zinc ribbon domain [Vampirovibrio sp.]